jgi:hypothetical protein
MNRQRSHNTASFNLNRVLLALASIAHNIHAYEPPLIAIAAKLSSFCDIAVTLVPVLYAALHQQYE